MHPVILASLRAFHLDLGVRPGTTLRGGDALDSYNEPPPYDAVLDAPTNAYLERYAVHALPYLDPASWRHYIPTLVTYSLARNPPESSMATEGFLRSLRPPDRDPPRIKSLTAEQRVAVERFLVAMAFEEPMRRDGQLALEVLQEWWDRESGSA